MDLVEMVETGEVMAVEISVAVTLAAVISNLRVSFKFDRLSLAIIYTRQL
jgi:hypothetical protein